MSSAKIILKQNKTKCLTKIPLYLRVTHNRRSSYLYLGHTIQQKYWDDNSQKVKSSYNNSARLNAYLSSKLLQVENEILIAEAKKEHYTAKDIIASLNKKPKMTFTQFADDYRDRLLDNGNYSRYKKLKGILSKLKDFNKNVDLEFEALNYDFLKKYELWLKKTKKNKINTIHSNMKFIRQLFREAITEQLVEAEKNPFLRFKLKQQKTSRQFLIDSEIDSIYALDLTGTREVCRDMFVFACDTGIRISDLLTIKRSHFDGNHLVFNMRKTKSTIRLKIPTRAKTILNKYEASLTPKTEYIFPPLQTTKYAGTSLDKAIMSKTTLFNSYLKEIANQAEIEKHLTFHVSRHSFGTRAIGKGIRVEVASKLMGHTDLKTTMIYAQIVNADMDQGMSAFD
jgi:integrase/recombinase XerD